MPARLNAGGPGDELLPAAGTEGESCRLAVLDVEDQIRGVPRAMMSDTGPCKTSISGTCSMTGASRSRTPLSASIIAAVAVTILVI
jgi:hypothetical protein